MCRCKSMPWVQLKVALNRCLTWFQSGHKLYKKQIIEKWRPVQRFPWCPARIYFKQIKNFSVSENLKGRLVEQDWTSPLETNKHGRKIRAVIKWKWFFSLLKLTLAINWDKLSCSVSVSDWLFLPKVRRVKDRPVVICLSSANVHLCSGVTCVSLSTVHGGRTSPGGWASFHSCKEQFSKSKAWLRSQSEVTPSLPVSWNML